MTDATRQTETIDSTATPVEEKATETKQAQAFKKAAQQFKIEGAGYIAGGLVGTIAGITLGSLAIRAIFGGSDE